MASEKVSMLTHYKTLMPLISYSIIANLSWCKHMLNQQYSFSHHTKWEPERLCSNIYSTSVPVPIIVHSETAVKLFNVFGITSSLMFSYLSTQYGQRPIVKISKTQVQHTQLACTFETLNCYCVQRSQVANSTWASRVWVQLIAESCDSANVQLNWI